MSHFQLEVPITQHIDLVLIEIVSMSAPPLPVAAQVRFNS